MQNPKRLYNRDRKNKSLYKEDRVGFLSCLTSSEACICYQKKFTLPSFCPKCAKHMLIFSWVYVVENILWKRSWLTYMLHVTLQKISHKNLFFLTFQKFVWIYQNREGYTKDHTREEVLYGNNNVMLCKVIKNNTAVLKWNERQFTITQKISVWQYPYILIIRCLEGGCDVFIN